MAAPTEADMQLAGEILTEVRASDQPDSAVPILTIARALADQRERLTVVDLYDEGDSIDLSYGTPPEIEDPIVNLICYTLTLPSGHIIRVAPWQLRALATAIEGENP